MRDTVIGVCMAVAVAAETAPVRAQLASTCLSSALLLPGY